MGAVQKQPFPHSWVWYRPFPSCLCCQLIYEFLQAVSEAREGLGQPWPKAITCLSLPACLGLCVPIHVSKAGIEQ